MKIFFSSVGKSMLKDVRFSGRFFGVLILLIIISLGWLDIKSIAQLSSNPDAGKNYSSLGLDGAFLDKSSFGSRENSNPPNILLDNQRVVKNLAFDLTSTKTVGEKDQSSGYEISSKPKPQPPQSQSILNLSPSIQSCTNELIKENNQEGFAKGQVIVVFKKGITADGATEIIKSYGLSIDIQSTNPLEDTWGIVKVPEGSEFEWVCRFKENQNIPYTGLNSLNKAF